MAKALTIFFVLISTFIMNCSAARFLAVDDPTIKNYTHVCDHKRFSGLGLDISGFGFCDKSLSYHVRAKDLVDRMTLTEKVNQLGDIAQGVPRIGLPKYNWWSEALHGVSDVGHGTRFDDLVPSATSFPTVILTAASFNESLWKNIGQVVSTEARAMYNLGRTGLTFWSPTMNLVRDPRWGRTLETPGEDPLVVGSYASNYVRGLQDVEGTLNTTDLNSRPLKVSACCKHYVAYDVDNWMGIVRETFDAKVTEQDMLETFLRPFQMCVQDGDVSSVMCSYNRVNGIPTCANPRLLKDTIRGEWDLHGYIVSDCDSIDVMVNRHKWLGDTAEDAVAQVLKAGLDLDCGKFYIEYTENATMQGKVREGDVDKSLINLYVVLMRLGFFDGSPHFESLGRDDVCSDEHIELAAQAAREGIVLLKNDNETLPLNSNKVNTLAVIGPHAKATKVMIGNYAGIPCQYSSPLDVLLTYNGTDVKYEEGCDDVHCKNGENGIFKAMNVAKDADATILFVGLDLSIEAESLDRVSLYLPKNQNRLIKQVAKSSKGPVILVIMSAGGVDITFAKSYTNIKAILWAGYPGEEGGRAIADVIFGKYNPGGRLPVTWYEASYADKLPMTSMTLRPVDSLGYPGRTYRFYNGSNVFPFGYGLSYTNFTYKLVSDNSTSLDISLDRFQHCHDVSYNDNVDYKPSCSSVLTSDMTCKEHFEFEIQVKNTGKMDGDEVIIVYSKPPSGIAKTHIKQVIGFKRVFVPKGGSKNVKFVFNACKSLSIVDYNAYKLLPSGLHTVIIGDGVISFPVGISFRQ